MLRQPSFAQLLNAHPTDIPRITLLLRPECLPTISAQYRAPLFSWLLDVGACTANLRNVRICLRFAVALVSPDSSATSAIFHTLECFTERFIRGTVALTYGQLVSAMIRMGAQPTVLQVDDTPDHLQSSMDIGKRDLLLSHLASLLVTLSK